MRSIRVLTGSIVILMLASLVSFNDIDARQPGRTIQPGEKRLKAAREKLSLNLTEEQKSKMQNLQSDLSRKRIDIQAELQKAKLDLREAMVKEEMNLDALKKIVSKKADLEKELQLIRMEHMVTVRQLLTPEQLEKVKLRKKMRAMKQRRESNKPPLNNKQKNFRQHHRKMQSPGSQRMRGELNSTQPPIEVYGNLPVEPMYELGDIPIAEDNILVLEEK